MLSVFLGIFFCSNFLTLFHSLVNEAMWHQAFPPQLSTASLWFWLMIQLRSDPTNIRVVLLWCWVLGKATNRNLIPNWATKRHLQCSALCCLLWLPTAHKHMNKPILSENSSCSQQTRNSSMGNFTFTQCFKGTIRSDNPKNKATHSGHTIYQNW